MPQDLRRGAGGRARHHPERPGVVRQLLSNVFDPSLVIGPAYQATTVATTDGRVLTGLSPRTAPRVVLKLQGGKLEIVPRPRRGVAGRPPLADARGHRGPGHAPELADLFAYITLDRPPGDPAARIIPGTPPGLRK